jgi:glucose/arabinose dehydrogenase
LKVIHSILLLFVFSGSQIVQGQASLEAWWSNLSPFEKPVGMVQAPGFPNIWFVVEQRGLIYKIDNTPPVIKRSLFLDLSETVSQSGYETGLLGLAFHHDFPKNGRLFLSYTTGQGKAMVSHISETKTIGTPDKLLGDPGSVKDLITVKQPYENHNGGSLLFGPDGFLYFSWGDGGSGGDPENNSQNLGSLLGKIHRIDVNSSQKPYGIPPDNPFRLQAGARPEVFAYGLRNVWQMQFDSKTGKLWAGDVGQNAFEEIDIIEKGKNYGWRYFEGNSVYKGSDKKPADAVAPVLDYAQTTGDKSVTGGHVYHGPVAEWEGHYIYGDFMTGRIWKYNPEKKSSDLLVEMQEPRVQVSCFALTRNGELLVCSYTDGRIMQLLPR